MKKTDRKMRLSIYEYVKKQYGSEPEYLWMKYPDYAVFRHSDNNKWYAIVMNISRSKLGLEGEDTVDILNVKMTDPLFADTLIQEDGFFRGYHISRGNWVSVLLDGTVPLNRITSLIDTSYKATASARKKQKIRPPKEWIIPANPKYYDIIHAFDNKDVIDWKQGAGIKKGDTVYMYVGAPVSAVLYRCIVTETDIPYEYKGKVNITALMKIELQKRYPPKKFTFRRLNDEFDIYAVRGPRGIPDSLSTAFNEE